jgi:hypothetical protein
VSLLLNPRAWLALIVTAVLALTHLTAYRAGRHAVQARWDAAKVVQEREANAAAARNRDLQRQAEKRYVVAREGQDRFFVETIKEIEHASAPLAACPVPEPVRVRLNAAAACARGDSPSACGAPGEVPSP